MQHFCERCGAEFKPIPIDKNEGEVLLEKWKCEACGFINSQKYADVLADYQSK
jgi:rubredoxin